MRDLRLEIFEHLQRLSIPYFDRQSRRAGSMTRVTSDVETLNELFSSGVVTVFGDVFTLLAIMALMLVDRLAAGAGGVRGASRSMWLLARVFRRRVRDAFRDIRVRLARLNSYLQEHLSGVRVVQLFGRERRRPRPSSARSTTSTCEAHLRSITHLRALLSRSSRSSPRWPLALLLWYGGLRTLDGTLTVGVLAAFIQLTRRFFQPLQDLSEKFNLLQSAMASSERIFRLLDEPVDGAPSRRRRVPLPEPVRGEVRVRGCLVPLRRQTARGC